MRQSTKSTARQMSGVVVITSLLSCALAASARAQTVPTRNIEYHPGPVVSSSRVTGMGGTAVGRGVGADVHLQNPTAFAARHDYSKGKWFDWDWTIAWLDEAGARRDDYHGTSHADVGLNLKFGRFGIGLHTYGQDFSVFGKKERTKTREEEESDYGLALNHGGLGLGWAFMKGQLVVGAVFSGTTLSITRYTDETTKTFTSVAPTRQLGFLWAPQERPWSLGLSLRSSGKGRNLSNADEVPEDRIEERPFRVATPWQIAAGASYELGLPWGLLEGKHILLCADLRLTGKTEDAITFASYLQDTSVATGEFTNLEPRLGADAEVIERRLRVRAGTYWEGDRQRGKLGKPHITHGGEVRLGKFIWEWSLLYSVDLAPRYFNYGLGIGLWR